jgi:hypothetical protein
MIRTLIDAGLPLRVRSQAGQLYSQLDRIPQPIHVILKAWGEMSTPLRFQLYLPRLMPSLAFVTS